jgi:hypothetical protein
MEEDTKDNINMIRRMVLGVILGLMGDSISDNG